MYGFGCLVWLALILSASLVSLLQVGIVLEYELLGEMPVAPIAGFLAVLLCSYWLAADDELLPYRIAELTTLAGLVAPPTIRSNTK